MLPRALDHAQETALDAMIRRLYSAATRVQPEQFRAWALEQIQEVIEFDAALWGTGVLLTRSIHHVVHLGLDEHYAARVMHSLEINPLQQAVLANMGRPVSMADVWPDTQFFDSPIYRELFEPYGIQRIMTSGHFDTRTGLSTLISLYRRDRDKGFSDVEKYCMDRLVPHMLGAASHTCFVHLEMRQLLQADSTVALCDAQGFYWEVQQQFLDMIEAWFPDHRAMQLPFSVAAEPEERILGGLHIRTSPLGGLVMVHLRAANPMDRLTERERGIVHWITRGLSFKEAARKLDLAPSTVSNHLYRIYRKLGVSSRTELAALEADARSGGGRE